MDNSMQAIDFDGTADAIRVDDVSELGSSTTVSHWVSCKMWWMDYVISTPASDE